MKVNIYRAILITIFIVIVTLLFSVKTASTEAQTIEIATTTKIELINDDIKCEEELLELGITLSCEDVTKIVKAFPDRVIIAGLLHESGGLKATAVGVNTDGSKDWGVFQINDRIWSLENAPKNGGLYYIPEDLDNSIKIAQRCYKISGYGCWLSIVNDRHIRYLPTADKLLNIIWTKKLSDI